MRRDPRRRGSRRLRVQWPRRSSASAWAVITRSADRATRSRSGAGGPATEYDPDAQPTASIEPRAVRSSGGLRSRMACRGLWRSAQPAIPAYPVLHSRSACSTNRVTAAAAALPRATTSASGTIATLAPRQARTSDASTACPTSGGLAPPSLWPSTKTGSSIFDGSRDALVTAVLVEAADVIRRDGAFIVAGDVGAFVCS